MEFHPGPLFANILLVDEINRSSPRTQSALLEVMSENQVIEKTCLGGVYQNLDYSHLSLVGMQHNNILRMRNNFSERTAYRKFGKLKVLWHVEQDNRHLNNTCDQADCLGRKTIFRM